MITLEDYFGRFTGIAEPSAETRGNAIELLSKVNALLSDLELPEAQRPKVNSGWRPKFHNAIIPNAAPNSKHISGQAIDIADPEGALDDYLMAHPQRLLDHDLYMEHPLATKGWCHLQNVPPRSGNRVFIP